MEPTLFRYIFSHSKKPQFILLGATLFSFPFLYMTLDLPKTIINEAIGGTDFPRIIFGYSFEQVEFLLLLCVGFICLVFVNGGVKFLVKVF